MSRGLQRSRCPGLLRGCPPPRFRRRDLASPVFFIRLWVLQSALALLVARVLADDHDAAVATDDLALVADPLDGGVDLHKCYLPLFAVLVPHPGLPDGWGRYLQQT